MGRATKHKVLQKPETNLQKIPYSVLLSISLGFNQVGFNKLLWQNYLLNVMKMNEKWFWFLLLLAGLGLFLWGFFCLHRLCHH